MPQYMGYEVKEAATLQPTQDGKETSHEHIVYDDQGIKSVKIDQFRMNVERTLKALRFAQFEAN